MLDVIVDGHTQLAPLLQEMTFDLDREGNFTSIDPCGLEMLGYSREEFEKGVNLRGILLQEQHDRISRHISDLLSGKRVSGGRYTIIRKDGTPLTVYLLLCSLDTRQPRNGYPGCVSRLKQTRANP